MKKQLTLVAILICITANLYSQEPPYNHIIFENSLMKGPYYYSDAAYESPSYIQKIGNRLPVSNIQFFTPPNSLSLNYLSSPEGNWTASVNYREVRGHDFVKESSSLDFKILLTIDTKPADLPTVAIAIANNKDTTVSNFVPIGKYINCSADYGKWCEISIPLSDFKNIVYKHSKEINEIRFAQGNSDGYEHQIYIDQIELAPINKPAKTLVIPTISATAYERHIDIIWDKTNFKNAKYIKIYRTNDAGVCTAVGIQNPLLGRFTDFVNETEKHFSYTATCINYDYTETPNSEPAEATTYQMTDDQLLTMVQEASFRYFYDGEEAHSGLALENIPGRSNMIAVGASGFGIMALIAGTERGFITRNQSILRFKKILSFLSKAETFHGAFPHFIDGETGKVEPYFGTKDNGADLVETAFLFQGLIAARQYFDLNSADENYIRTTITKLWNSVEWDWFKQTKDSKYLYWHWSPDQNWVINHKLIGWNETMIVYLLAIASPTHGIPAEMYYSGWASQDAEAQAYRSGWGESGDGKNYTNGKRYYGIKLDIGVNGGGPSFFTQFSFMGFNPHLFKDRYSTNTYFETLRNMSIINYRYCLENPKQHKGYGADCWGLTACEGPNFYGAFEAYPKHDWGYMCPAGALGAFPYTPEQSMDAMKNYYRNYGSFLWGEYGFRDAFSLNENWCSTIYMGLNQGAITTMIENYRTGLIWKLFMKDAEIKAMCKKLNVSINKE